MLLVILNGSYLDNQDEILKPISAIQPIIL